MNNYRFWQSWGRSIRLPYLILLVVALAAIGVAVFHYLTGFDTVIRWEKLPALQPVDATLHEFSQALHQFSIPVNGYVLTEKYDASLPHLNIPAAAIYLVLVALCLTFYVAVISTFKRFVYIGAMLLLMLYLATFNFDLLGIFGPTKQFVFIGVLVLLGGISYAFQAFFPETSFPKRLLASAAAVAATGAFIFLKSPLPADVTALHLVNYSATGSFFAAIIFIILIAYENIHALLWINTQASSPKRRFGLWQFMFISLLYLLNLTLLYFRQSYIFDLNIFYIDAYLILLLSFIAGFWGMQQREAHFSRLFSFYPGGAFLYLIFGMLTALSIGYAFATANDPLIGAFNDIIVFTHLAYGAVFFLYILINFRPLISQRLRVYKVVYDPKRLPFYTVMIMGTLLLGVLLLRARLYTYNQAMSGYFNYLGDLNKALNDDLLAERFYQEGAIYEHHNVKSNYSLAGMAREKSYRDTEINYLKEALLDRPDPKLFTRLGNMYTSKEYFFEQLFILKHGIDSFPQSSQLYNNLALLYNQTSVLDSVGYYLALAKHFAPKDPTIRSNELGFLIKNGLATEAIQQLKDARKSDYLPLKSNVTLLQKLSEEPPARELPELPAGRVLTPQSFAYFYHTVLHRLQNPEPVLLKRVNNYLAVKENALYDEDLSLLKAALERALGQKAQAKKTLEQLASISENTDAYYYDIIGLWLLEDGLYPAAAAYFERSKQRGYLPAYVHRYFALALSGKTAEALSEIPQIYQFENPDLIVEAQQLKRTLELTPETAAAAPDSVKLQYTLFRLPALSPEQASGLISSIQKPELRALAKLAQAKSYFSHSDFAAAQAALNEASPALPKNSIALSEANLLQFDLWLQAKNYADLRKTLQKRFLTPEHQKRKAYYLGVMAQAEKNNAEAQKQFDKLLQEQPFFEQGLIAAANFYTKAVGDNMRAYDILQEGISLNRYSAALYKAYVFHSLSMGFDSYAESGMQELQRLLSPEEYATFNAIYQDRLKQAQTQAENW